MPSLLPGFEVDIFVSYRHNDNRYDGWVTEFVAKLQQELDATIKDKLTIYFDRNPREGLLETYQVQQSIQGKIKSLIFIPIISQTYCDTNSFAWKDEFMVFTAESEKDNIGKIVSTPSGNVISRILPVKIHEIDVDDVRLLERQLGGVMRSIDFIYTDAGVNRPLRAKDDDLQSSHAKLLFRNQINKVANSVKEVMAGIKRAVRGEATPLSAHSFTSERPLVASTFSTSLPAGIKVQVIDANKPSVFLAWTSSDLKDEREEMSLTLQRAGFNVVPTTDCPADDEVFKRKVSEELQKCACSLHILGNEFGRRFELDSDTSFPQYQYEQAKAMITPADTKFRAFIWNVNNPARPINPSQQQFIRNLRNTITRNIVFTNSASPMQLVDDMRAVMMKEQAVLLDSKDTDIFFIFHQQDEGEAGRITDAISEFYPVEALNIMPDGDESYREKSAQQIPRSKLAVVYFKYAADWAIPFVKQIWKEVGGASSPTQLMLVGDNDPATNVARIFKAPKVVSTVVPTEEVTEEIKKVYVRVVDL